jgi:hypothetical protein
MDAENFELISGLGYCFSTDKYGNLMNPEEFELISCYGGGNGYGFGYGFGYGSGKGTGQGQGYNNFFGNGQGYNNFFGNGYGNGDDDYLLFSYK